MTKIHVGLNLVFLTPGSQGGMEVYARELIARLAERQDLRLTAFVNLASEGMGLGEGIDEVVVPVRPADRKQWVVGEQAHLPRLADRAGCDIVHSLASTAPVHGRAKRVTTIHDLQFKLVPGAHSRLLGTGLGALVRAAAWRSHRIITDSASAARDLENHLRVRPDKIDVVLLGVNQVPTVTPTDVAELRCTLGIGTRDVVLSLSAKRPSKNLVRLIQAHAVLVNPRPVLVLPGYPTPHEHELRALTHELGSSDDVRFLGWISDEDREGLYAMATVFAFPSLYEGFGLPPLEAMARGVPVLSSSRGALAEVIGAAALIVDPESVREIHDGLQRILVDHHLQSQLRDAGRDQAQSFTWDRTAAATADVYHRAFGTAPGPTPQSRPPGSTRKG
jgi:glycosyltransferase involved in cell wall biosynthesis